MGQNSTGDSVEQREPIGWTVEHFEDPTRDEEIGVIRSSRGGAEVRYAIHPKLLNGEALYILHMTVGQKSVLNRKDFWGGLIETLLKLMKPKNAQSVYFGTPRDEEPTKIYKHVAGDERPLSHVRTEIEKMLRIHVGPHVFKVTTGKLQEAGAKLSPRKRRG